METPNEKSERKKAYLKEYRQKNKEALKIKNSIRTKRYYENNREVVLAKQKIYKDATKAESKVYQSNYQKKNRDKVNSYARNYIKNKRDKDPLFKIRTNLRVRFRQSLKVKGLRKHFKTIELIGCDISFLKQYLEDKFLPTMTWENYGDYWHIDHIKPCSLFDLSKKEKQKECFHYTNLQPLFAVTQIIEGREYLGNINKGNKYET